MTRFIQFLREATWRTKPVGTLRPFNFQSHSLTPQTNPLFGEAAANPSPLDQVAGAFIITGDINTWLYPEVVSSLLYAGIGQAANITTTGVGPYNHQLPAGEALDSVYMELGYDSVGTREILGGVINQTTINCVKRERCTATMGMIGAKEPNGSTLAGSQAITTTVPTPPFVFHEGTVDFDTVAQTDIEAASLTVNNNVADDKYCITATNGKYLSDITGDIGNRTITWALDLRFDTATNYNKFVAGTEFALNLDMIRGTNTFSIDTPKCIYTGFPTGITGRDRKLVSAEVTCMYDTSATYALEYDCDNDENGTVFDS